MKLTKEQLEKLVSKSVADTLADHKDFKALSDAAKLKAIADAEEGGKEAKKIVGDFLKAVLDKDGDLIAELTKKDLSEAVDAEGGYLVPTEFRTQLVEKMYADPSIRRYATVIPMAREKMDLPVEGDSVSVNWTPELSTILQSDPTFALVELAVNMLAGISRMSRQLLQDSALNEGVQELIVRMFARVLREAEDTAFMVGTGSGQPKGIRTYTISQTVAQAGANLADTDLDNLVYTLPRQYRRRAVWIMRDDRRKLISAMRSTDGKKLHPEIDDEENPRLKNRPVLIQDDIPGNLGAGTNESEIYFGAIEYYYVGDREQMFVEVSTQEGQSFEKHRAAIKVGQRLDGKLTLTEALAKMTAVK
jgi:HK97 family phage major capsid protein